jgi:hypothetical protein
MQIQLRCPHPKTNVSARLDMQATDQSQEPALAPSAEQAPTVLEETPTFQ